jgi:hypothetical protein
MEAMPLQDIAESAVTLFRRVVGSRSSTERSNSLTQARGQCDRIQLARVYGMLLLVKKKGGVLSKVWQAPEVLGHRGCRTPLNRKAFRTSVISEFLSFERPKPWATPGNLAEAQSQIRSQRGLHILYHISFLWQCRHAAQLTTLTREGRGGWMREGEGD